MRCYILRRRVREVQGRADGKGTHSDNAHVRSTYCDGIMFWNTPMECWLVAWTSDGDSDMISASPVRLQRISTQNSLAVRRIHVSVGTLRTIMHYHLRIFNTPYPVRKRVS